MTNKRVQHKSISWRNRNSISHLTGDTCAKTAAEGVGKWLGLLVFRFHREISVVCCAIWEEHSNLWQTLWIVNDCDFLNKSSVRDFIRNREIIARLLLSWHFLMELQISGTLLQITQFWLKLFEIKEVFVRTYKSNQTLSVILCKTKNNKGYLHWWLANIINSKCFSFLLFINFEKSFCVSLNKKTN